MTQAFTKFISDLIQENIIDTPDDDIIGNIDKEGYPTSKNITQARAIIDSVITKSRINRLQSKRQEFISWKKSKIESVKHKAKDVDEMISEIVGVMASKPDNVPEGLLIAFRNQDENTSDEDIESLWNDLVSLGLIDPKDTQ